MFFTRAAYCAGNSGRRRPYRHRHRHRRRHRQQQPQSQQQLPDALENIAFGLCPSATLQLSRQLTEGSIQRSRGARTMASANGTHRKRQANGSTSGRAVGRGAKADETGQEGRLKRNHPRKFNTSQCHLISPQSHTVLATRNRSQNRRRICNVGLEKLIKQFSKINVVKTNRVDLVRLRASLVRRSRSGAKGTSERDASSLDRWAWHSFLSRFPLCRDTSKCRNANGRPVQCIERK